MPVVYANMQTKECKRGSRRPVKVSGRQKKYGLIIYKNPLTALRAAMNKPTTTNFVNISLFRLLKTITTSMQLHNLNY